MIEVTVNGETRSIKDGISIAQLLEQFQIHERMVVVEHNGEIIPRTRFLESTIGSGDNIEIVQMMAGG